ncbi:MAG: hypothetical protein JST04_02245 [Bdellovibrionales bacterium]|nr:hypothetical protein [Bdellovibrionales bacterium]
MIRIRSLAFSFVTLLTLASCSTLVGNVKPVDQKSTDYGVIDLSKENPKVWKRLDDSALRPKDAQIGSNKQAFSSEITDLAFQSKRTSAIISLNSSCREGRESIGDLAPYMKELLLGMREVTEREETTRRIDGIEALQTIVAGTLAGEHTKIHAIVLSKEGCVYDLMYISRPERYPTHEGDFNRFVSSLKLR